MTDDHKGGKMNPAQFGTSSAVAFALFSYLGHKLDEKYDTGNAYMLGGLALALVWTFYEVWKIVRSTEDD